MGAKGDKKTGGRRPNTANKTAADIARLARDYGRDAIQTLAGIMMDPAVAPGDRARCASILLERGYGRPTLDVNLLGAGLETITIETTIISAGGRPVTLDAMPERVALPVTLDAMPERVALPADPVEVLPSHGEPAVLPAPQSFYRPKRRCLS